MSDVYWFAHYVTQRHDYARYGVEKVEISSDGKTAYLYQLTGRDEHERELYQVLRLSIVSDNPSFKFTIMDAYTTIHTDPLTGTYQKDFIATQGSGVPEKDRSMYGKLAIASGKVIKFDVAVVIEMIDPETVGAHNEIDIGYKFTNMNEWVPTADTRGSFDDIVIVEKRGTPNINTHLVKSMNLADAYLFGGNAYDSMILDYYRALTDAHYLVRMLGRDLPSDYKSYKNLLEDHKEGFALYREAINNIASNNTELVYKLMSLK